MKVIFDFDDVLFNAKEFKELIFFYLGERGIRNAREVYEKTREREKTFSILAYLKALGIKESEIKEVYEGIMTPCAWLVNKEVVEIMSEVGKQNSFILSQGDEAFQRDKIERSLGDAVLGSHVIVVPSLKTEELKRICDVYKNEQIIFVDDKTEFLNDLPLSELSNLKTVLFDEKGLETLRAEIEESKRVEKEKLSIE